jgi:L,D-peptidoglycan transpeptidase YkuD (ErfK/YbiS/YcfS/YnhG family)
LAIKSEGDGATPIGRFPIHEVLYRSDRTRRPRSGLPCRPLRRSDGWCDDPADRNYNRPVSHPYAGSAETMWRRDHLYDVVVVLGYNLRPRVRGRGSAIFMHLARPGYAPTAGCIALSARNMRIVLERLAPGAILHVTA